LSRAPEAGDNLHSEAAMRVSSLARFAVLAAVLCIVGCNSNNKGKIEGTKWSSQSMSVKGQTIPAGSIKFEFTTDGKMTYKILETPYTGRYSLGSGDYVTLHLDQPLEGSKTHRQRIIIRGDTLQLIDTDGTSITFDRMK
jgi:hypothetical protein